MKRSIIAIVGLLVMSMVFTACLTESGPAAGGRADDNRPAYDREGFAITLPDEINTIVSIGPSNTEILVELGFGDFVIATDFFSGNVPGIAPDISVLDMMALDAEFIIDLHPCVIFITGMTRAPGADDPLWLVSAAGISVIYLPTSASIADIMEDIRFIAAVMEANAAGEAIIADMQAELDIIAEIAAGISGTRTVYFEISPAPWMFSFGSGTFLHEMLALVGAINIFADEEGWMGLSDEVLLVANPDVILTSTDFIDDPIGEIMGRPGWDVITAVQNADVFMIDADASSRPSHNIIYALWQMARAIHPAYFE